LFAGCREDAERSHRQDRPPARQSGESHDLTTSTSFWRVRLSYGTAVGFNWNKCWLNLGNM
jgi:hypothetical protein